VIADDAIGLIASQAESSSAQKCRMCIAIYFLWFTVVAGSLSIGIWRSLVTGDEGKGFTDAAYVVAVGGVIVFPIQARHNQRCTLIGAGSE
jgi:hypothetical protein